MVGGLCKIKKEIREEELFSAEKLARRQQQSAPIMEKIFAFITELRADPSHLPKNKFVKGLQYQGNRRSELHVFLGNPDVPIDTSHLERGIRSIAMGRRAWLFC